MQCRQLQQPLPFSSRSSAPHWQCWSCITTAIGDDHGRMATMSIEQALALAVEHHDAGRLPKAESIYRQILSHVPDHPETLRMLALLAYQVGRATDALPLIERAIKAKPS